MPVTTKKVNGFRNTTPGGVKAKSTTKAKAERQANLLRAVEHGWKPTGKPARKKKHNPHSAGATMITRSSGKNWDFTK